MKANKFIDSFIEKNKKVLVLEKSKLICEREFIKVYIESNSVLANLKNSTKIVYEYLFYRLQQSSAYNQTYIMFTFKDYRFYCKQHSIKPVGQSSFYRSRTELEQNDVIDFTGEDNYYYFNLNFFFNGDRIKVIMTYIKDNGIVLDANKKVENNIVKFPGQVVIENEVESFDEMMARMNKDKQSNKKRIAFSS